MPKDRHGPERIPCVIRMMGSASLRGIPPIEAYDRDDLGLVLAEKRGLRDLLLVVR